MGGMTDTARRGVLGLEIEFLVRCAGAPQGDQSDAALVQLTRVLDWDDVIDRALAHGVVPQLWRELVKLDSASVPSPVLKRVELLRAANELRGRHLARRLV